MSIIIKIIYILIISSSLIYSQTSKECKVLTILVDLKSKYVSSYSFTKDSTGASFGIYINGFQSKDKRHKIMEDYKRGKIQINSIGLPTFSVEFYNFYKKPEKIMSIDTISYVTEENFSKKMPKITVPTYIIHKLKDGSYLKWKTIIIGEE